MPSVNLDEETLDKLLLEHLKNSIYTCLRESKWLCHPEDLDHNVKIIPALLTVIEYFSAPNEYKAFATEFFNDITDQRDNDDEELEQIEFNFDDEEK